MLITHWFWAKHPRAINRIRCPIVFYFVWGTKLNCKMQHTSHFLRGWRIPIPARFTLKNAGAEAAHHNKQHSFCSLLLTREEAVVNKILICPDSMTNPRKCFNFPAFLFYEWLSSRPFWEWKKNDILKVIKFFPSHACHVGGQSITN